jgi:hypothetical protein
MVEFSVVSCSMIWCVAVWCGVVWYVHVSPAQKESKQNDQYMPHTTTGSHFIYTYSNSLPQIIYMWGPTSDIGATRSHSSQISEKYVTLSMSILC